VRRIVDEAIEKGKEPTKAKVRNAVAAVVSGVKSPEPKSSDRPVRARPSEKELRRIFKRRPALNEARELLWEIQRVAYCTTYDECDLKNYEECVIVTPALFWEYLSIAGEDKADFADTLRAAIKTLKAILAAMPSEPSHGGPEGLPSAVGAEH
jgi:hypothetical protein